jgi:hypothetical protein
MVPNRKKKGVLSAYERHHEGGDASIRPRHGFQIGIAAQLGVLEGESGFVKYEWLPAMNTPVFATADGFGADFKFGKPGDFIYGVVPGTGIKVVGPLMEYIDSHTAILGVTGSGKTELAFEIIREAIDGSIKVICIDLTSQYAGRLSSSPGCKSGCISKRV